MLLFTNDVLEMAVAKSNCKDTTIYWNERTFHRKTSIKSCFFSFLDACKQLSQRPKYTLLYHHENKAGIAIWWRELQILLHNNCFTLAQHVLCKRITADMQAHNSCCATDGSDFPGNIYLLFQQLILLLTTTYKSFLRCLFLLISSSNPHQ